MKINLFVKYLDDKTGGEKIAYNFADYLYRQGIDFNMYCGEIKTKAPIPFAEKVNELGLIGLNRFTKYLSFHKKSEKVIKNSAEAISFAFDRIEGCDIYRNGSGLHRDYLETSIEHYPHWQKFFKKLKRAVNPVNFYLKKAESDLYCSKSLKKVIVNSSLIGKTLVRNFPFIEGKIEIIHNGIDKSKFNFDVTLEKRENLRKKYFLEDKIAIGHASNNFERKGLRYIIQALSQMPKEFVLLVAGSRNSGVYKELATKYNVSDRVFFLGHINDMEEFYPALDIFCLPSLYDPFPSVIPESLGMGVPVVCSKHIGSSEIVNYGKNGIVLNELTVDETAKALRKCSDISVKNFSKDIAGFADMYSQYLKTIESVLKEKK